MQHFEANPDTKNQEVSTRLGIYEENCGLDKVTMSWGHDEYMYLVLKGNATKLPPAAHFIIRFHSFYGTYIYIYIHPSIYGGINNFRHYFFINRDNFLIHRLKINEGISSIFNLIFV